MALQHDRQIRISAAGSRRAVLWQTQSLMWSEMVEKLRTPVRSAEPLVQYLRYQKRQQDDLKDVGGYVGGELRGGRRKNGCVISRDILALDLDAIPASRTETILKHIQMLGFACVVYSTRKHEPGRPRLRVVAPFDKPIPADAYEPVARWMAAQIGIELCDPTTFEVGRLMYWPSCCCDGEYVYAVYDAPMISAEGVLAQYQDWRDTCSWARCSAETRNTERRVKAQEDPETKKGVVGVFCRTYNIYQAMDEFIPDTYAPVDNAEGRYTYTAGSTTGGAIVYDGKWLYSHHATDPCGGQLVNAFDLVRLHKYAALDDDADPGTPAHKLASYRAMSAFATSIDSIRLAVLNERTVGVAGDFGGVPNDAPNDGAWKLRLKPGNPKDPGSIAQTRGNAILIMRNDPALRGLFGNDLFARQLMMLRKSPWDAVFEERRAWTDEDDKMLRCYLEGHYGFDSPTRLDDATVAVARENEYDDAVAKFKALRGKHDGIPRLDTLLIDVFGAEDTPYVRAVSSKPFVAAVARALKPGTKFDNCLVLKGAQGIGKSTFLRKMGEPWFCDNLPRYLEGRSASARIQGKVVVELAELDKYSRTEVGIFKEFLSRQTDTYRNPYDKRFQEYPRRCVIFATVNEDEFLRDTTGNRRFWVVEVKKANGVNSPETEPLNTANSGEPESAADYNRGLDILTDDYIEQLWAEAVARYDAGEKLWLPAKLEAKASEEQAKYMITDARAGMVQEWLDKPLPDNWAKRDLQARRIYWADPAKQTGTCQRDFVCAAEVWCELFGREPGAICYKESAEINAILRGLGWSVGRLAKQAVYGVVRGYARIADTNPPKN